MSLSGVINRLDDWINPIVVKELRQAVKSRLVTSVLLLFLVLQLVIVSLFLAFQEAKTSGDPMNARAGRELFMVLQAILLGTCMVLIPTYASVRLSNERSDTNVDLLFISTLRPTSIIAGKFFSALVLAMLVYSCCAPFMTFTYLLRGIDIPSILFVMGLDLFAVILSTQVGLFLASVPAPRALKMVLFLFALLMLCWIYAGLVAVTEELLREGVSSARNSEFWAAMGVTTLAILLGTGQLFCWSVALISPPSANRALRGRLFLVGMWLILGAVCLAMTLNTWGTSENHGPLTGWMVCGVILFCIQFIISINERDTWGSRVARTIPRRRDWRVLAFLFYSGSAGGVLLSVICIALTLFVSWIWREIFPTFRFAEESDTVRRVFTALALFTFCYGMSAVLLRTYLLSDKIRQVFTWVLGFLLFGLGSSLPWMTAFIIHYDHFGLHHGLPWWWLTNPFGALYEIGEGRGSYGGEFIVVCFLFLSAWALLLAFLSIQWVVRQVACFHPLVPRVSGKVGQAFQPDTQCPEDSSPAGKPDLQVEAG